MTARTRLAREPTFRGSIPSLPSAGIRYPFAADHPDFEAIDLTALGGRFPDLSDWRSSIVGEHGRTFGEMVWSRIVRTLKKPQEPGVKDTVS